jgi:hypothetical protein
MVYYLDNQEERNLYAMSKEEKIKQVMITIADKLAEKKLIGNSAAKKFHAISIIFNELEKFKFM